MGKFCDVTFNFPSNKSSREVTVLGPVFSARARAFASVGSAHWDEGEKKVQVPDRSSVKACENDGKKQNNVDEKAKVRHSLATEASGSTVTTEDTAHLTRQFWSLPPVYGVANFLCAWILRMSRSN